MSMRNALSGTATSAALPIAAIVPSRTMTVWPSRAAVPVPSITRAFVKATTGVSTRTYARVAGVSAGRCACAADPRIRARPNVTADRMRGRG